MADFYDIDKVLGKAISGGYYLAATEKEWSKLAWCLQVIGEQYDTFAALSSNYGASQRDTAYKWRHSHGRGFGITTTDQAASAIIGMAKAEGVDLSDCKAEREWQPRQHRSTWQRPTAPRVQPTPPPQPPRYYIDRSTLTLMEATAKESGLYLFMAREWGAERVNAIFAAYHMGGSKYRDSHGNRAASFPYINSEGLCVDCKIFHIDPESGSRKQGEAVYIKRNGEPTKSTFALAVMGKSDLRGSWCNFGDHLLTDRPGDEVAVVESEKTALIAALSYPQKIWVACGSITNLNPDRFKPYRGRAIILYPDKDGVTAWEAKGRELTAHGYRISINRAPLAFDCGATADIADLILLERHGELKRLQAPAPTEATNLRPSEGVAANDTPTTPPKSPDLMEAEAIWERMKADNPQLAELEQRLDLHVIGFTDYDQHRPK